MDYNAAALAMHEKYHGKLAVESLFSVKDRDALSTAYTPGVAEPCRQIAKNPEEVYRYTLKSRTVAVVTNGTAVLGLGNIGPEAGLPVMEGKCVLFKEFGGVDAFPICLNATTKEEVVAAVKAIAPTFGGINLEDIRSPECFEIEAELERDLDIPVFHDDQHGTAIIVLAGVLNALKVVGKDIRRIRVVQNGPGAAGTAIIKMLQTAGVEDIVAVDEHGILYPGRPAGLAGHKASLAQTTNPRRLTGGLAEAVKGGGPVYRHLGGRRFDQGDGGVHGAGRHRVCHGEPQPGDPAGRRQGRRRPGGGDRAQRLPQPGQQRAGFSRHLQGGAGSPGTGHQRPDEAGGSQCAGRSDPGRRSSTRKTFCPKPLTRAWRRLWPTRWRKAARESGVARL